MSEIIKRNKALSVNPIKSSQTIGASLAFLGINRSIPMMHGSQGCTAFGKVFFVRHFREPIPLQTTAMDQVSSVMGADDNIVEGLKILCEKSKPDLIGLPSTGLAEIQGCDLLRALRQFRELYPQFSATQIIPVNTPDFSGCLESGFASALYAMIDTMVPHAKDRGTQPGRLLRHVNVLVNASLTPGDLEALKDIIQSFNLQPRVLPDIADSLDGHLSDQDFSPLTVGGCAVSEFSQLGDAMATLVIGPSLYRAANLLNERTGVPHYFFDHLMGLDAVDQLISTLSQLSNQAVPAKLMRQRAQLQDTMVDTHFMIGQTRVAMAADPDLLLAFSQFFSGMGADLAVAVSPARGPALEKVNIAQIKIGDLEDLEQAIQEHNIQLIVGSSHAVPSAQRLKLPILRTGFPLYDQLGAYQRTWIGYQGARQTLFDLANLLMAQGQHEIHPYYSIYSQKLDHPVAETGTTTSRPFPWNDACTS